MTYATLHNTNHPRRAHPAVLRAALRSHNRNDTESGRVAAQQRGTHRPTPCGYNRLIEVHDASNAIIATYRYDPFGRRLSKTANNQSTYYFYSAEGLIAEADANGQITQSYGYAPGSTFTTNPLWTKLTTAGTTTYYTYQNDHLGTPQKLLNQSGLTVWSATYDAFGKATVDPASTITNNLRFPGQYQDQETGLHYNWMRFYDPKTGRYVTSDPIGLDGGINLYAYVGGNPLQSVDPYGLFKVISQFDSKGIPFYKYREAKAAFDRTPAGRREKLLNELGEVMRAQLKKCKPSSEAQQKFDEWVVNVDPNIDNPRYARDKSLRPDTTGYALTSYDQKTTQFNLFYFEPSKGDPDQYETFLHEFRHLMKNNHDLPNARALVGQKAKGEEDADKWANQFRSGKCSCN